MEVRKINPNSSSTQRMRGERRNISEERRERRREKRETIMILVRKTEGEKGGLVRMMIPKQRMTLGSRDGG